MTIEEFRKLIDTYWYGRTGKSSIDLANLNRNFEIVMDVYIKLTSEEKQEIINFISEKLSKYDNNGSLAYLLPLFSMLNEIYPSWQDHNLTAINENQMIFNSKQEFIKEIEQKLKCSQCPICN